MRTWGLLHQLGSRYPVTLIVLSRKPLSDEQISHLGPLVDEVINIPLLDVATRHRLGALARMLKNGVPYHPAVLRESLKRHPEILERIWMWQGIVFTNTGHWGTLAIDSPNSRNWILNQCDADIQFWQAYATQISNPFIKIAALLNLRFAERHFPNIYQRVGRVISVSEEDQALTSAYSHGTPVEIIRNGIDAATLVPARKLCFTGDGAQLLFTGTAALRNIAALHGFLRDIFPKVLACHPEARLLVAGNFPPPQQEQFKHYSHLTFTGRVPDLIEYYNKADIFIAPFRDAHGSKLKVAEAMAMGLPVVATHAGVRGFPVMHGESALVADSNEEFAYHINQLIENPAERERIGTNAREFALQFLDWQVLGTQVYEIVDSMAADMMN